MASATLSIDLNAIATNWRALDRASASGVQTAAVVKADAYGLGLGPVVQCLARAGARRFFVATAEEGTDARTVLGPGPQINVLSGHMAGDTALIRDAYLIERVQHRRQVAVADQGGIARHVAGQDINLGPLAKRGAGVGTLIRRGDKEAPCAGLSQALHDRAEAEAVGISLDHACGLHPRSRGTVKCAPVGGNGVEVDGEDGAGHVEGF